MTTKKHQKTRAGSRRTKRKRESSRRQKQSNRSQQIYVAILGVVFILLVVGLMWQAGSSETVELASPEVLAQGETIYRENCVACHGDNGEGGVGPGLNGSAHSWHHPDQQLISVIRDGIPGTQMAPQGDKLSEEEINAVISYLKSWWSPQQRRMQQQGRH